ncbi:DUF373 family protein [Haloarchaeobius sp. TZWWS8]|uniref:DUF373 family protein n=1 Tax=Haloarchaeobius sp. TZWWS8 TaxID=3446121 RepID=UPI003EB9EDE2
MATLVVCVDRTDDIGRKTGLETPVVGWEAVRSLVTDVGLADPEDSSVNCLLETLRVARDLRDENEETVVAVVSGTSDTVVGADRAVAHQLDQFIERYDLDSAVVVIDSAQDERLVPVIESRLRVDSVDRVVVRQARDIESTYYLLKQFLADEELRQTVLVPLGLALVAFPALALWQGPAIGAATITAIVGVFLLYKGFAVDELLKDAALQARGALYSGNVSVVTYVVAAGLTMVGLFVGVVSVQGLADPQGVVVPAMRFVYDAIPWLAMAGAIASIGRLLDEAIGEEPVSSAMLNLPFTLVSVSLVIRGISAYFLERARLIEPVVVPRLGIGQRSYGPFDVTAGERLAAFVGIAVLLAIVGVRIASIFSGTTIEDVEMEQGS